MDPRIRGRDTTLPCRPILGYHRLAVGTVTWDEGNAFIMESGPNWPEGPVSQGQTGPKGQYFRSRVSQDQTGPKGQYIRGRLARRASKSGPNWPEGPVLQDQTGPVGQ